MAFESGCLGVVENAEGVRADRLVNVTGTLLPLWTLHGSRTTRSVSPVCVHAVTPRSSRASFIDRRA